MTCCVDECDRAVGASRGMCPGHYRRFLLYGNVHEPDHRRFKKPPQPCAVEGCERLRRSSTGHCGIHARRLKLHGDVNAVGPSRYQEFRPCDLDGCANKHYAKGYCKLHYDRGRKGSRNIGGPERRMARRGEARWWVRGGYVMIRPPGAPRPILEHRWVMQQWLGRELLEDERVHHRNGVCDDNRITNLELWTVAHPAGQRVADKVEWARELLALYEGYADAACDSSDDDCPE